MKSLNVAKNVSSAYLSRMPGCLCALMMVLAVGSGALHGQVVQVPTATALAGIPSGYTPPSCSTSITQGNGANYGDGCLPTQATLNGANVTAVDSLGNVYIGDNGHVSLRVIYKAGANLAAAIVASYNNSAKVTAATIKPGNVYTLVGGCPAGTSGCYAEVTNTGGTGTSTALTGIAGIALDADGNVFFTEGNRVRVFYVAGTAAVTLLQNAGQAVTTPHVGYQYTLVLSGTTTTSNTAGYKGDGAAALNASLDGARGLAIDSNEDLYIADYYNRVVRKITASTGFMSTFAGGLGCVQGTDRSCTDTSTGDGGPAFSTSTSIATPSDLAFDANGNLYISEYDQTQKIRAVYMGTGTLPGITAPSTGYIYTVAGGGTTTGSGATATGTRFGVVTGIGLDAAQNLYVIDKTPRLWEIERNSQVAVILAGSGAATTVGGNCSSANTGGSKATDTVGDGCPGIQSSLNTPYGHIAIDASGDLYVADQGNNLIREYVRSVPFATTALGASSAVQTIAFASVATQTVGAQNYGVQGAAASDFANAGAGSCIAAANLTPGGTCLANVKFTPQLPGLREGYLKLTNGSGAVVGTAYLGGTGTGAELAIDTGNSTQAGSGLKPLGVAVDAGGNVYVADGTSNTLLQYTSASAAAASATLITGLSAPGQVAVDGQGNVAVADAGNNRVAFYNRTSGIASALVIGTPSTGPVLSLSAPQGVAADASGNFYIADTGNNRVIETSTTGAVRVLVTSVTSPTRLAFDASGNLFILDSGNHRVVEIPGATGVQTTVSTLTYTPADMVLDAAGDLYVLDSAGLQVGVVSPGGSSYSLFTGLQLPVALAIDALDDLYVADSKSGSLLGLNRQATTLSFGPVTPATTSAPLSFMLTSTGSADTTFTNASIATITGSTAAFASATNANACTASTTLTVGSRCGLSYTFTPPAAASYSATVTFPANTGAENMPSATLKGTGGLVATALTITPGNFNAPAGVAQTITVSATESGTTVTGYTGTVQFSSTDGAASLPASYSFTAADAGTHTFYNVTFATAGMRTLTVTDSANGISGTANVTVTGTAGAATNTLLSASSVTPPAGSNVTLTATVSSGGGTPTGSVSFTSGSTLLGTAALSGGTASIVTAALPVGGDSVMATYVGNSTFASSTSMALTVTVSPQNVWIVNNNGTLSELANSGAALSGTSGFPGGGAGIAIDGSGNVWSAVTTANSLTRVNSAGAAEATFTGGGLNAPVAVAVSGSGAIWVANTNNTLSLFDTTGAAISPAIGYTGGGMNAPSAVALDASGNVWVANKGGNTVTEFLGAADPVVSPLSVAAENSTQGAKP